MKPIVFNTQDVKSIQDGKKTQSRRLIKPQPNYWDEKECIYVKDRIVGPELFTQSIIDKNGNEHPGKEVYGIYSDNGEYGCIAPYKPGDVLYVRETWTCMRDVDTGHEDYFYAAIKLDHDTVSTTYLCDDEGFETDKPFPWKPPLSMPKKLARLFLLVTDVKAQRLQDITPRDAWEQHHPVLKQMCVNNMFKPLWNTVHPKNGWDTNPWVWVISFEKTEKPESEG